MVGYYHDGVLGAEGPEDAYDMRKSLSRDKEGKYVRENGENHRIEPHELYSS